MPKNVKKGKNTTRVVKKIEFIAVEDLPVGETYGVIKKEAEKSFRLLGLSVSDLYGAEDGDHNDFLDLKFNKAKSIEETIDNLRAKLGDDIIKKGRSFEK